MESNALTIETAKMIAREWNYICPFCGYPMDAVYAEATTEWVAVYLTCGRPDHDGLTVTVTAREIELHESEERGKR